MESSDLGNAPHRLDLRFGQGVAARADYPVVTILVDGEDVLATRGRPGYIGFDPEQMLGPDWPLLPTRPPRRVALYRCRCGEAGCGVVAPMILTRGDLVVWSDFRDFTGVYDKPIVDQDPDEGERIKLSRISFDGAQYRDEVRRASSDRSWETPSRETARLLSTYLDPEADHFRERGLHLTWAAPHPTQADAIEVSFRDAADRQLLVVVTAAPGPPADRAGEMVDFLLRTAAAEWPRSSRSIRRRRG